MRKSWLLIATLISLGLLLILVSRSPVFVSFPVRVPSPSAPLQTSPREAAVGVEYKSYQVSSSTVHTVRIPAQGSFQVVPAVSLQVNLLDWFARQHSAIAVINGGFFDPANQQSTSYIISQGKQVADPQQNDRLMDNPDLAPYLEKILDRSEFRRYQCGELFQYAIARHQTPPPSECQLLNALGGGPRLLPTLDLVQEGFWDEANGTVIRDSLGSRQPNARSAIGLTADGSVIFVMVAQTPAANAGLSLPALAEFMRTLGVKTAMNLDGGSSSSLYYKGKTVYGKLDDAGSPVKRPVKSVLLVQPIAKSIARS